MAKSKKRKGVKEKQLRQKSHNALLEKHDTNNKNKIKREKFKKYIESQKSYYGDDSVQKMVELLER